MCYRFTLSVEAKAVHFLKIKDKDFSLYVSTSEDFHLHALYGFK